MGVTKKEAQQAYVSAWVAILDETQTTDERDVLAMFEIEGKSGESPPFYLNPIQDIIFKRIREQEILGKPVRIIILKPRQVGCSTLIDGWLLVKLLRRAGQKCLIMAHKEKDTKELFQSKVLELWKQVPAAARPKAEVSTQAELEVRHVGKGGSADKRFTRGRSNIRALTAGSDRVGRSWTFQRLHLSEAAFFRRAEEVWGALSQTVGYLPGTSIIMESTANGASGFFYDTWMGAIEGKNGYIPLFFPWYEHPEYVRPFESEEERAKFLATLDADEKEVEQHLRTEAGMDDDESRYARLNWYRWCLHANCHGDRLKLQQEYPSSWQEAFIASGRCRFDMKALRSLELRAPKPIRVGRVRRDAAGKWTVVDDPQDGTVQLFRWPVPGREYIIGVDVGNGANPKGKYEEYGDYSTAVVRDRKTRQLMALIHKRIDGVALAHPVRALGTMFNEALVVVEKTGPGAVTIQYLRRAAYPNLYRRRASDDVYQKATDRYGWATTGDTRDEALGWLAADVSRQRTELCKAQIDEFRGFVLNDAGKYEAREKMHDDLVMADSFLSAVNFNVPYERPDMVVEEPEPRTLEWLEKVRGEQQSKMLEAHEEDMLSKLRAGSPDEGGDPILGSEW